MIFFFFFSFTCQVSVALTLTNCAGYAYFYGYTVEIVTSILLILCCGLALDYSAHIGVAYLTGAPDGSSRQGARKTTTYILYIRAKKKSVLLCM